jgi:hypothetical protein
MAYFQALQTASGSVLPGCYAELIWGKREFGMRLDGV